jgi:hypothetical protein
MRKIIDYCYGGAAQKKIYYFIINLIYFIMFLIEFKKS